MLRSFGETRTEEGVLLLNGEGCAFLRVDRDTYELVAHTGGTVYEKTPVALMEYLTMLGHEVRTAHVVRTTTTATTFKHWT